MKQRFILYLLGTFILSFLSAKSQIVPYLQTPTQESVIVNWRTATDSKESFVYYGTSIHNLDMTVEGSSQLIGNNQYSYQYHTVEIKNLQQNTKYYYQVKSNNLTSDIYSFNTPPAVGQEGIYRFLILGDHQLMDDRYVRLMQAAKTVSEEKYGTPIEDYIHLITNVGDQVNEGIAKQYDLIHFKQSEILSPNIPILTIVGNHETYGEGNPLDLYKQHFYYDKYVYKDIKSNSKFYYATQQGRVLFLMLSSEHPGNTQKQWVEKVVAKVKEDESVDWIISYTHRPIQAEQYVGDISYWVRDEIMPILNTTHKSVLNVGGHHHLYHRGQLRDYPTYHIISGGAAWDQRWGQSTEQDFDDVQKTIAYWPFQIVELDSDKQSMYVETYVIGNEVERFREPKLVDTFSLIYNQPAPDKPEIINDIQSEITLPYTFISSAYNSPVGIEYNSVQFQIATDSEFTKLEFDLIRDYENIFGAHPAGANFVDLHEGLNIFEQEIAKNDLTNGVHYVRVRHRDRNLSWSEWSDVVVCTIQGGKDKDPALNLNQLKYQPGENILIEYEACLGEQGQWLGIYKEGENPRPGSHSTAWKYAEGSDGSLSFQLNNSGVYFAAIFRNDVSGDGEYDILVKTDLFYVGSIPELSLEKNSFSLQEQIKISYSNAPALENDWIGVYRETQRPGGGEGSLKWSYVQSKEGFVTFNNLPSGDYFATYLMQDKYFEPGERVYFQVVEKDEPSAEISLMACSSDICTICANGILSLKTSSSVEQDVKVYNTEGLLLGEYSFFNRIDINLTSFPKGMYFVHVNNEVRKVYVN